MLAALISAALLSEAALQPSSAAFQRFNKALDDETDAALTPLLIDSQDVAKTSTPAGAQPRRALKETRGSRASQQRGARQSPPASSQQQRKLRSNREMTIGERMDSDSDAALAPVLIKNEMVDEAADEAAGEVMEGRKATSLFEKRPGPELAAEWLIRKYEENFGEIDSDLDQRRQAK